MIEHLRSLSGSSSSSTVRMNCHCVMVNNYWYIEIEARWWQWGGWRRRRHRRITKTKDMLCVCVYGRDLFNRLLVSLPLLDLMNISLTFFFFFHLQSFEENAESECQRLVDEALKYDPESPEVKLGRQWVEVVDIDECDFFQALQVLASLRISQVRTQDALTALEKSFHLWENSGIYLRLFDYF